MRVFLACLAAVILIGSFFAAAPTGAANDEAAIREIVQKYMEARERHDPRALEALFTSDADQHVSAGAWCKGRSDVGQETLASSQNMAGKRTITMESVRFLSPDVAIADGCYEITGLPNGQTRKMWTTFVLTRISGGWCISAIRDMLPAPPSPK